MRCSVFSECIHRSVNDLVQSNTIKIICVREIESVEPDRCASCFVPTIIDAYSTTLYCMCTVHSFII